MKRFFIALVLVAGIGGCATEYSCGQFPDAQCTPVSSTYEETNTGYHDYRQGLFVNDKKQDGKDKSDKGQAYTAYSGYPTRLSQAESGDPLLTKPVYLRLSFNDWVDLDGNLNSGGYVYVKIKESEWITTD